MTIVEKIIKSIKGVLGDDFAVYYHDDPTLNIMTSRMEFPCALLMLLTTGTVVDEAGQLKERVSAAVFFVEPSQYDFDAVDNETIIDRCKRRALFWYSQRSLDQYVDMTMTRSSRVYNQYDDILTGYGLFLEITELEGYSDCEEMTCPSDFSDDFNNDFGGKCFVNT